MDIMELLKSVQNDVRQGAYDQDELLLLCQKTQQLIENMQEIYEIVGDFYTEGEEVKKLPKHLSPISGQLQLIYKLSKTE